MRSIPNLLSGLRLILTPFIAAAILGHRFRDGVWLLFIAGWTDFFDGRLARRYDWHSKLGAVLDPIADKALLVTVYVCLAQAGAMPWWLAGMVLGRDVLIVLMAVYALLFSTLRGFPPSFWGKLSTAIQIVTGVTHLVHAAELVGGLATVCVVLQGLAAAGTAISGADYFYHGLLRLRASRAGGD